MAQALPLPDGTTVAIREGETPTQTWARAQRMYPDAFGEKEEAPTKAPKESLLGSAVRGTKSMLGSEQTGLASLFDANKAATEGLARQQQIAAEHPSEDSWEKVKKAYQEKGILSAVGEYGRQIPNAIAEQAPQIAQSRLGAAAGAASPIPGGALAGAFAPSFAQQYGSFLEEQAKQQQEKGQPIDVSRLKAAAAAIPAAAIDVLETFVPMGKSAIKSLFPSVAKLLDRGATKEAEALAMKQLSNEGFLKTLGKGTVRGVAVETPGEVAQQMLQRAQAGQSLFDEDALADYGRTAFQTTQLGPLGAVGRFQDRAAARAGVQAEEKATATKERTAKAQEAEAAQAAAEAERNTPDYALKLADQLKTLEQEKLGLQGQIRKVSKDSTTEAEDKAHNKEINAQLRANAASRDALAPEKVRLVKSGLYEQALEERRVAGLTPEEYALEQTKTVANKKPKVAEPDLEGYYEQQIPVPSVERRKAQEAEQQAQAEAPAKYAAERMELARTQMYDPTGEDYLEYLLHNPFMAQQIVETKTRLPGVDRETSSNLRNDLKERLLKVNKEELAARQADLQAQKPGQAPVNPMAAFMEQSEGLNLDRTQGQTDADIAFAERHAMPRAKIQQGELFGTPERVNVQQQAPTLESIPEKLVKLQQQLDVARAARNTEKLGGRGRMSQEVSNIIEQMRLLKEQQAKGEGRAGTEFGTETAGLQAYVGAGEEGRASELPVALQQQQEAVTARVAATERLQKTKTAEDRQEVLTNLVSEIQAARGTIKPETVTAIEDEANALLDRSLQTGTDITPQLDQLSNRWRAGTRSGQTVTTTATPTSTTTDALREQMDRAFAQRDQYDTQTMSILEHVADNLSAVTANPERRNMIGEWLNRVTTTGRSSPEMTRDVQEALSTLERGKLQENGQQELSERFMPKQVAPQATTRVVNGKVQYVAAEDRGPLQGNPAERYAPIQKGTAFGSAEEFQKFLAGDALKSMREAMGLTKQTASRMHERLGVFRRQVDGITKQLALLQERKAELQRLRGAEANTARALIDQADANLKKVYERLDAELHELQIEYLQAKLQHSATDQIVADIGKKVADNIAQFENADAAVVEAAQATAAAKESLAQAKDKPVNKQNFSDMRKARQAVIDALYAQRKLSNASSPRFVTFLNADLGFQLQLKEEEKTLEEQAQVLHGASTALEAAAAKQKRSRKNQKEIKQAQQELSAALGLQKDAVADVDTELKEVTGQISQAQEQLRNAKEKTTRKAPTEQEQFAALLEAQQPYSLSTAELLAKQKASQDKLAAFQARAARLAALPGQRIDFSKRRGWLELVNSSEEDFAALDQDVADIDAALEFLRGRNTILSGAAQGAAEAKSTNATNLANMLAQDTARIAQLEKAKVDIENRKIKLEKEVARAEQATSSDPEVVAAITESIDKRLAKLDKTVAKKKEDVKQTEDPATGKPVPEKTIAQRKKDLAKYEREQKRLMGLRSNRLGVTRTSTETGERFQGNKAVKKTAEELIQEHDENERNRLHTEYNVQLLALKNKLVAAEKQNKPAAIVALNKEINKVRAQIIKVSPRAKGRVSPATREQSAAPSKMRSGTEESKADQGVTRQPITEQRTTAQPTAGKAVEDANAFAERLAAAKNPDEMVAELKTESAVQRFNVLQGIKTLIADFRRNISRAENELQPLLDAAEEDKADLGAFTFIKEMREKTKPSQNEKGLFTYHGVDLDLKENGDNGIYVSLIRTNDPTDLRTGKATRALVFLKRLADKHNVTLTLRPELVGESKMSAKQLEEWYEREGFTSGDAGMYRNPETSGKRISELRNIIGKNNSLLYRAESNLAQAEAEAYPSLKEQELTGENVSTINSAAAPKKRKTSIKDSWDEDFALGSEGVVFRTSGRGAGMDVDVVQQAADEVRADWTNVPEIVVVQNESGLPSRLHDEIKNGGKEGQVPGLYDPDTKTVYLIADNLHSVNDVALTVAHEVAGHFGLREMLGSTYSETMQDIYAGNPAVKEAADAKQAENPALSKDVAVEEVLADMAEQGPYANSQAANALRRIFFAIKQWFQSKLGIKNVTDNEVKQLVANARRYVKKGLGAKGGAAQAGTAVMRTKAAQPTNDLEQLAHDVIAQPKTWREKAGNHVALQAEMQAVDMRAGLAAALKAGAKEMGDENLYTQAMYNVRKADQKMPLIDTVMRLGPLELYKDEKGLYGVRSSNKNSAKDVLEAVAALPYKTAAEKDNIATIYMIAQRAANKGLSKLDLGALGVTEEKLAKAMAVVDADPELKAALENVRRVYNEYNKGLINFLVETRRISKAFANELLKDGDYVPYYRVQDNGLATLNFGNNKMVTIGDIRRQPYLAQLKGGETKILPISESLPRNTLLLTDMALTNMSTRSVGYALQAIGKGKGEIDPKTGKPKNLMAIHSGEGPADGRTIRFYEEPDPKDPDDDGKRWVQVDTGGTAIEGIPAELVVQSLEGAHLALPEFLKLAGVAGDLLRTGVTRTPLYIARQLFKDPMSAAFTGGLNYNAFTAVLKAGKEFVKMTRGTSDLETKLLEKGLIQSGIFAGDVTDMKKMALQIASGKDMSIVDKIFAAMDRAAMRADATTRALVMENALKNGLSEVEADMATMESMNFYKRGLSPTIQYANRLIPFLNAQIQGLNVLYKAARGQMPFEEQQQIKRKFLNNAALLTATGIVYAMAMEDDDYYKNAKPRDKYSNFFLHLPGVDEPLKLPIPYEAGYFFSLAVAAVDGMREETDGAAQWRALKDMFLNAIPGYSSMGVPQIVKPAFEVWTNKNFLTGAPVESLRLQGLDPEARYNTTTTELAKSLAKAIPILSPIQIEHLVRGYLGVLPLAAAAAANDLFKSEAKGEQPEARVSDLPLIGTQFQKKFGGADNEVVFHLAQEAKQAHTTLNTMLKEGRRDDAMEYRDNHRVALASASAAGGYQQLIGRINLDVRRTQERNDLSPTEKRERLNKLDEAKQAAAQRFIQLVKKLEGAAS